MVTLIAGATVVVASKTLMPGGTMAVRSMVTTRVMPLKERACLTRGCLRALD